MATHSSILAWRILWLEEPGGLLSIGLHRVGHDWSDLACMHALEKEMATQSSILAWRIPGTEEPGGLLSMGSHRVRHDWSDLAAAAYLEVEYLGCMIILFLTFWRTFRLFSEETKPLYSFPSNVCMLVAQSCLTLCNPMDYSPPSTSAHGIHQARILE